MSEDSHLALNEYGGIGHAPTAFVPFDQLTKLAEKLDFSSPPTRFTQGWVFAEMASRSDRLSAYEIGDMLQRAEDSWQDCLDLADINIGNDGLSRVVKGGRYVTLAYNARIAATLLPVFENVDAGKPIPSITEIYDQLLTIGRDMDRLIQSGGERVSTLVGTIYELGILALGTESGTHEQTKWDWRFLPAPPRREIHHGWDIEALFSETKSEEHLQIKGARVYDVGKYAIRGAKVVSAPAVFNVRSPKLSPAERAHKIVTRLSTANEGDHGEQHKVHRAERRLFEAIGRHATANSVRI